MPTSAPRRLTSALLFFLSLLPHATGSREAEEANLSTLMHAAGQGSKEAQFELGDHYDQAEHFAEAAEWYRKAAEQDHGLAAAYLGGMLATGTGVEEDQAEALRYHRLAAAAPHDIPLAMNNLGTALLDGTGVKQDVTEAVKWFRKAGDKGDYAAIRQLVFIYQHGAPGVEQSKTEAKKWYRLAAAIDQGLPEYNLDLDRNGPNLAEVVERLKPSTIKGVIDSDGQPPLIFASMREDRSSGEGITDRGTVKSAPGARGDGMVEAEKKEEREKKEEGEGTEAGNGKKSKAPSLKLGDMRKSRAM